MERLSNVDVMKLAYTVCSANYLPFAKALADSLLRHNTAYQFVIVLAERTADFDTGFFAPHRVVPVTELGIPDFETLNARYDIFELSCALKPFAADYLFRTYAACNTVFYFDSDIFVYASLALAEEKLRHCSLLLTPHITSLQSYAVAVHTELDILRTGLYNAGFFGLSRCEEGFNFLNWWKERLWHHCFNDAAHGRFVDQIWLNLAPHYFKTVAVLFDPGYNFAYWNFFERSLGRAGNNYVINGSHPLVFLHFSGYDMQEPETVSKHRRDISFEALPASRPLFEAYRAAVLRNKPGSFFHMISSLGKPRIEALPETPIPREKNFFKRKWKKIFKQPH